MRRLFCLFFAVAAVLTAGLPQAYAQDEAVPAGLSAKAYALVEIDTGRVIAAQNADACLPMASTTKIMTALVAIQSGKLDEIVDVIDEDAMVEGSSLGLRGGDAMTLENMVRGMMAVSGNDAAHTIARFLGDDDEGFAELMNAKAAELGMENSHFANPHGLPDDEHFSTAEDMAKLAAAALKEPVFLDIVSSYKTEVTYIESALGYTTRKLTNSNKLLNLVEGCIGVKTGYTKKSGRCLVSAVRREGAGVVCVVLNCPDYWNDSTALLEYGMTQVTYADIVTDTAEYELNVVGGTAQTVRVQNTQYLSGSLRVSDFENMTVSVELPKFVYAPVRAGDTVGEIVVRFGDEIFAAIPMIAMEPVDRLSYAEGLQKNFFEMIFDNITWMFT